MPQLHWKNKGLGKAPAYPTPRRLERYTHNPENQLIWGDNHSVLERLKNEATLVDLIYLDPPFCSAASYHQTTDVNGQKKVHLAYDDHWQLDDYLQFIFERLHALKEVLNSSGSLFLHCDRHQSHHLRCLLEEVFGRAAFRNEIIWHYTGGGRSKRYFSQKHDTIFWFSNTDKWTFNIDAIRQPYKNSSGYAKNGIRAANGKVYKPNPKGTPVDDTWDIPIINPMAKERVGYPTQKPLALLNRIVRACSNPNDVVLDPFLGSGTSAVSAAQNNRRFIGIDVNPNAIHCTRKRLLDMNFTNFCIDSHRATQFGHSEHSSPNGTLRGEIANHLLTVTDCILSSAHEHQDTWRSVIVQAIGFRDGIAKRVELDRPIDIRQHQQLVLIDVLGNGYPFALPSITTSSQITLHSNRPCPNLPPNFSSN